MPAEATAAPKGVRARNLIKQFLQVFLPLSVAFGLIVAYIYFSELKRERLVHQADGASHIKLGKQLLREELESVVSDLMILARHTEFSGTGPKQPGPGRLDHLEREFLIFTEKKRRYDQIRLIDTRGMEVIRVNFNAGRPGIVPQERLQDKRHRYYVRDTLRLGMGEVFVSPLDLNIEHGKVEIPPKPMIRFATPLFNSEGEKRGMVIINYLASRLIEKFNDVVADANNHVMITTADGFWLSSPQSALPQDPGAGHGHKFESRFPQIWERIRQSDSGQFYGGDGLITFDTIYPASEARQASHGTSPATHGSGRRRDKGDSWKIVTRLPQRALDAGVHRIITKLALIAGPVYMLLIAGGWWLATVRTQRLQAQDELRRRARQQAAVAQFGQQALSGVGLDALMNMIVKHVAEVLDVEYCKILELLPGGEDFLLRAGTGWKPGLVGLATVPAGMDSQAGYTLASSDPVIVRDLRQDARFDGPRLLRDYGIVSGMSVIIHGGNQPFGVLGAHTSRQQEFTKDDIHFLQAVANILSEAIALESARAKTHLQTSALEATAEGIVITDRDGNIQWVNTAYTRLTGYAFDEVVGRNPRILKSGKHDRAFYKDLWDTIVSGRTWHGELWNKRKDGSLYPEEETITPVLDDTGEIIHFVGIKRDITERQQLQRQLQQAQKMEAIGQLTGGIAHDFNNILVSIMGYTELAREEIRRYRDGKLERYLDEVYNSGRRARDLVAQMLAFSRGGEMELKPLLLAPLLKESLKMLGSTLPSSIELHTEFEEGLPPVMTDPVQLQQLVMNLCINARDAMEGRGSMTIGLRRISGMAAECRSCHERVTGDHIELFVQDAGHGIKPERLDRIFDPFFTTKEVGKGTGMGLSMVHGIMHGHHGHILVDSQPGRGSTFRLLFPLAGGRADAADTEDGGKSKPPRQLLDAHILVVDDETSVGQFLAELLENHGARVTVETDSHVALENFRADPEAFDLVVTDQTMPGLSGAELAQAMLRIRPALPVVLCTGYSDQVDEAGAKALGIRGYLEKPLASDAFLRRISELLREVPAGAKGAATREKL